VVHANLTTILNEPHIQVKLA